MNMIMKYIVLAMLCINMYCSEQKEPKDAVNTAQNLAIGIITGGTGMTVYLPFAYAQNRVVQNKPISRNPLHWYRGLPIVVGSVAPITGMQVAVKSSVMDQLQQGSTLSTNTQLLLASSVAGFVTAPLCNASELIGLQQQNSGRSLAQETQHIMRTHGAKSLTRGLGCITGREIVWSNAYQALMPLTQKTCESVTDNKTVAGTFAAVTSGIGTAVLTNTFQVLKAKLHADLEHTTYKNGFHAAQDTYKNDGVKGVTKGIKWRMLGMTATIPVMVILGDYLTEKAKKHNQQAS